MVVLRPSRDGKLRTTLRTGKAVDKAAPCISATGYRSSFDWTACQAPQATVQFDQLSIDPFPHRISTGGTPPRSAT